MNNIQWVACNSDSPKTNLMCVKLKFHSGNCLAQGIDGIVIEEWKTENGKFENDCCMPIDTNIEELKKEGVQYTEENKKIVDDMIQRNEMLFELMMSANQHAYF